MVYRVTLRNLFVARQRIDRILHHRQTSRYARIPGRGEIQKNLTKLPNCESEELYDSASRRRISVPGVSFLYGNYFQVRYGRIVQVGSGFLCAIAHLGQCLMICHYVDGVFPTDSAVVFNLLARCISEWLLVFAMVLALPPPELGIFDSP